MWYILFANDKRLLVSINTHDEIFYQEKIARLAFYRAIRAKHTACAYRKKQWAKTHGKADFFSG